MTQFTRSLRHAADTVSMSHSSWVGNRVVPHINGASHSMGGKMHAVFLAGSRPRNLRTSDGSVMRACDGVDGVPNQSPVV